MRLSKKLGRSFIIPLLYGFRFEMLGIPEGLRNVILNYHGVIAEPFVRINRRHLSTIQFENDLRFCRRYFDVVSLKEIFENPATIGSKSRPKLSITFDDGFENNLHYALPLLEKYNLPATIFVLSEAIDRPDFVNWTDLLDVLIAVSKVDQFEYSGERFVRKSSGFFHASEECISLAEFTKSLGEERLEFLHRMTQVLDTRENVFNCYGEQFKLLDKLQILECNRSGLIEIGSHTANHYNLGRVSIDLVQSELMRSRGILQDSLQIDVDSIAYPDGDYSIEVKDIAELVGYRRQLAVDYRFEDDISDLRIRNRFSYSNSTTHYSNFARLGYQWRRFSF